MVMKRKDPKTVGVAELKAKLSEYLREARRGRTVTVLDRETPVAQLVPMASNELLSVRPPAGRHNSVGQVPLPPPACLSVDPVALLLEDRESGR
jgi:prevent-host-death family protein